MAEPNLYKREGIFWLRAKINGQRFRESLRTSDLREARRQREKRLKQLRASAAQNGGERTSWKAAVVAWGEHAVGQLSASTMKRYLVSLAQVEPHLESKRVDEIDGPLIASTIRARSAAGAKPATIRRDMTAISAVLTFCDAQGWTDGANPTLQKRKHLRERRNPISLPTEDSIRAVLDVCSPEFAALVIAARLTGCRQAELVNAKWPAFNADAETLEVVGKGNRLRTIKLTAVAKAHIESLPRRGDLMFCWQLVEPGAETRWVRFSQAASDFTHFRRAAEARAKKDERPFVRFRFHDLRHLFAVEALRGGMGIYRLSKHLGHTSVKTTEIYLAFLTPEQADRVREG